jgi:uncharacterized protein YcaQ
MQISKTDAKRFILLKQGLHGPYKFKGKEGILEYINQAGCIQFDPIDICGKNHELVLQSRVAGFKKPQLYELLYEDRKLVDLFDKNMAIVPVEDWPYLSHFREYYQNGGRFKEDIDRVAGEILEHIDNNGPLCSADIQYTEKVNWYWAPTSLGRAALDTLYYRGDLIVHHKKNTRKYYDIAKKHIQAELLEMTNPNSTPEKYYKWHLLRRIKSVGMLWNRASDAWLGISGFKMVQRNMAFSGLLSDGLIREITVDEIKFPLYIASEDMDLLENAIADGDKTNRTEFIAPLDNMMWDRRLVKELFGFDYKWEIYTPVKDRKFGYYVLPLLYSGELAGRVEIKKNKVSLKHEIANLWLEPGVRETKKLHKSINSRLYRFNRLLSNQ